MATPSKSQKTMSSRLLTMKFMQRAAASGPAKGSSTGDSPQQHPSKRVRLSDGTAASSSAPSDYEVVQAALAAEESKRAQAIEKQAAEAGETRWVLSFQDPNAGKKQQPQGLRVVSRGFADIDGQDDDSEGEEEQVAGRKVFGKREEPAETKKEEDDEDDSDQSSSEGEDSEFEYDPEDPTAGLINEGRRKAEAQDRAARKAEKKASKKGLRTDTAKSAAIKRHKGGNPHKQASLSSTREKPGARGGPKKSKGRGAFENVQTCHRCGQPGHKQADCGKSKQFDRIPGLKMHE